MSDSNWNIRDKAIVAAFFLFCGAILAVAFYWSGSLAGYQDGRRVEARTGHEAQTKHLVKQSCISLTGASLVDCVYDETAAAQEAMTSEQDLDAQQGMEHWAFWMFVATTAQAIIASSALVFLMKDLRQNRKSAEQQLRAYLTFREITWNIEKGDAILQIEWVNRGQTPAYNADTWADWKTLETEITPDFAFSRPTDFAHCPVVIGPEQSVFGLSRSGPTIDTMRESVDGTKFIYVWGEATYVDAFGVAQVSQVAVQADARRLKSGGLAVSWNSIPMHNDST